MIIRRGVWFTVLLLHYSSANAGELIGSVRFPTEIDPASSPAVVYVVTKDMPAGDPVTALVDQRDLQFAPRVLAVPVGSSVIFRNSDREAHNINSRSDCCSFNLMVGPERDLPPIKLERVGLVRLLCNIHQQMRGFIVICPNTYFAVTSSDGRFQIAELPNGPHKIVVWQEFSKAQTLEITVDGSTPVEIKLELVKNLVRPADPTVRSKPSPPWTQVLARIESKLHEAVATAQQPGELHKAERLTLDAYFEHFEASEMEAAVRLFSGEERVFDIERMFARIRRPLLGELANGTTDEGTVRRAVRDLISALDHDVQGLYRKRIYDRTGLPDVAQPEPATTPTNRSTAIPAHVLSELEQAFERVVALARSGQLNQAEDLLAETYFDVFHQIEPALAAADFNQARRIESGFLELRASLQGNSPPEVIEQESLKLRSEIELAVNELLSGREGLTGATRLFWNSFVILTREGFEALLIITALLMYLSRTGQLAGKHLLYLGIAAAIAATVLTWLALQWLIARSAQSQELIEGISALAAAAVLFYVSYWLLSKSEARRWQEFLTRQVDRGVSAGSQWALLVAAFLAVYREGAETILMFQPMLVNPTQSELVGMLAGAVAAAASLALICWGLRFATFRLAIRPFFRVTGVLLFALSVIFAGKGVIELQEAGVLAITPLSGAPRSIVLAIPDLLRDILGIGLSVQSMVIQGALLNGVLISIVAMWGLGRLAESDQTAEIATESAA